MEQHKKDKGVCVDPAWLKLNEAGFKEAEAKNHGEAAAKKKALESQTKMEIKCNPHHGSMQTALTTADGDTTFGGAKALDTSTGDDDSTSSTTKNAAAATAEGPSLWTLFRRPERDKAGEGK